MAVARSVPVSTPCSMESSLYWIALTLDPVAANMVKIAYEDSEIDLPAAVLAWQVIVNQESCTNCVPLTI
jgi:hypothetical protein